MQNKSGFVRWMFRGWYRDLTLWGLIIGLIGFLIMAVDGPLITVWFLLSVGLALVMFDLVCNFLRFQYSLYTMERDRVTRELERK
jgi:hypothetical protein